MTNKNYYSAGMGMLVKEGKKECPLPRLKSHREGCLSCSAPIQHATKLEFTPRPFNSVSSALNSWPPTPESKLSWKQRD